MAKLFRFKLFNVSEDGFVTSKRWGTADAIERLGGVPIGDPIERDVGAADWDPDLPGLTHQEFKLSTSTEGFQAVVKVQPEPY
jgi:hypothetical protein